MSFFKKNHVLAVLFGFFGILLLCLGCKDTRDPVKRDNINYTESFDIFEKPLIPKVESPSGQRVIATVNGMEIRQNQLEREATAVAARLRNQMTPERIDQERDKILNQALNNLIMQSLLRSIAELEEIKAADEEVQAALKKIRESVPSNDSFTNFLQRSALTETGLVAKIKLELRMQALVRQKIGEVPSPAAEEISAYYDANQAQFNAPERVKADYVLVFAPQHADDILNQERTALASRLQQSVLNGASVREILEEYPEPDVVRAGSGTFARGQMDKNVEEILFTLETNQTGEVASSPVGFHIFRVKERLAAGVLPLDEVKENISAFLTQRETQNRMNQFFASLRDEADIKIHQQSP